MNTTSRQTLRAFLARRKPLTMRTVWAHIRIAQLRFDLWFSRHMQAMDERQIELANFSRASELSKQADIKASIRGWLKVVA